MTNTEIDQALSKLTPTQQLMVELVTKGLSNAEIGHQVDYQPMAIANVLKTVIYPLFDVETRAGLIVRFLPYLGYVEAEARAERENEDGLEWYIGE